MQHEGITVGILKNNDEMWTGGTGAVGERWGRGREAVCEGSAGGHVSSDGADPGVPRRDDDGSGQSNSGSGGNNSCVRAPSRRFQ